MPDEPTADVQVEDAPAPTMLNDEPLAAPVAENPDKPEDKKDEDPDPVEQYQRQVWEQAGLGPDTFDTFQPESREVMLREKLAAARTVQAPAAKSEDATEPDNTQKADAPPVPQLPSFDAGAVAKEMTEAYDTNDGVAFAAATNKQFQYIGELHKFIEVLALATHGALQKQDSRLGDFSSEIGALTRPAQLRAALAEVKTIAVEADFAEADKLLASGEAKSAKDALVLAAGARLVRDGLPDTSKDKEEALRKARALRASGEATSASPAPSQKSYRVPRSMTDPAGRAAMKDIAEQAQGKK